MVSDQRLAEIKSRAEKATAGPWQSWVEGRDHSGGSNVITTGGAEIEVVGATVADQDFMANARQDIPELIEEIERLRAQGTR